MSDDFYNEETPVKPTDIVLLREAMHAHGIAIALLEDHVGKMAETILKMEKKIRNLERLTIRENY